MLKRLPQRCSTINNWEGGICLSALLDNLSVMDRVGWEWWDCRPKQALAQRKLGHNDLLYLKWSISVCFPSLSSFCLFFFLQ